MSFKKFLILPIAVAFMAFGVGSANAQVVAAPKLAVQLATTGLTNPITVGSDATVARLTLDTTGSNTPVRISSLPLSLSVMNGANAASLTNCRVFNENNTSTALNSSNNIPSALTAGMNTITLDSPIVLPAGTVTTLDVRCVAAANLVPGGSFQFSLNTANVVASDPTTGTPAVVTVLGATTPVTIPVTVPVTVPVVTPTVPNTGAGGEASTNVMVILGSLAAATLGLAYARKAATR